MDKYLVKSLVYDRYNPERAFFAGDIITVSDPERLKSLLSLGIITPFDDDLPEGKPVKEFVKKEKVEEVKAEEPKVEESKEPAKAKRTTKARR